MLSPRQTDPTHIHADTKSISSIQVNMQHRHRAVPKIYIFEAQAVVIYLSWVKNGVICEKQSLMSLNMFNLRTSYLCQVLPCGYCLYDNCTILPQEGSVDHLIFPLRWQGENMFGVVVGRSIQNFNILILTLASISIHTYVMGLILKFHFLFYMCTPLTHFAF